ncbi:MAG: hypothetical protein QXE96_03515 [Candidatus Caldarchaeum sp.]
MAKQYVDFYVKRLTAEMASALSLQGFEAVCVEERVSDDVLKGIDGLRVFQKAVVDAYNRGEVLEFARKHYGKRVISVRPFSREALMTAGRDERVASVIVHGEVADFDRHVAEVLFNPVEVTVAELVKCFQNVNSWGRVTRFLQRASVVGKKIIVSSGAADTEEILPPHQLGYVAAALTGGKNLYTLPVSGTPLKILRDKVFGR